MGRISEAQELLFLIGNESSASITYLKALIEYMRKGISSTFKKKFAEANKINLFVPDYITRKKVLPNNPIPYYGMGDEREAIACMQEQGHLWWKEKELVEWIRNGK